MKRMVSLSLALALCLGLAACAKKEGEAPAKTPEELADAYAQAISGARDQEMNEFLPVMTNTGEADAGERELIFSVLGFAPEDARAYGLAVSLMNIRAYAIAAVMPAEGKAETVQTGMEEFIEAQKSSFEFYLEDQYEIAANAKLETLDDGTVLLVMCPDQDAVLQSIKEALGQ